MAGVRSAGPWVGRLNPVGQGRPALDRERDRSAEGEAHRDAAATPAARRSIAIPSPPIEIAIARSSSSASPGRRASDTAAVDPFGCDRSGVNRPRTPPTSTVDCAADVAGGSARGLEVQADRADAASASSSRRYRVTPAPNPASRSSTLASPNPAGSAVGARSGTGRTHGRSRARRVRRSPRRPADASTRRASEALDRERGGGRQQLRTRQVGLEVQVGSGGVDRDATAVVPRRRLVVGTPATGERDLLRLHADGSERRVAVPRACLAEVEEREAVRVRDERPAGVVSWQHHPVAVEPADHARRDGLEPGRPSYLAELHGSSAPDPATSSSRGSRTRRRRACRGSPGAPAPRRPSAASSSRGRTGRPGVALGAGRRVDIPAQREPVAFVEPDPDAVVREERPPVADRQEGDSGSARSNGTSTRTAGRPSAVPRPSTVRRSASASVEIGSTRSVGVGAAVENGRRLRTTDSRWGQVAAGHGAGPAAYHVEPSTTSFRSVGVAAIG